MWYKGIVMEVKDKYLIVMREDSTLVKIDIKDKPKVGERLIFTDEDIYEVREAKSLKKKNMTLFIALAAVLVLCILPIINNGNLKAYALVSLDINPSIEFELDENKNIINIYTINTDAKSIDLEDIKGLKASLFLQQTYPLLYLQYHRQYQALLHIYLNLFLFP